MKFFHGLVACLVLVSVLFADGRMPVHFRYWKPIERAPAKDEEIVAFSLDSDIYASTRDGFPDIRIVDDAQSEAPYLIEAEVEHGQERSRQSVAMEIGSLRPNGNAVEVRLRLPANAPAAEGFSFTTPLTDYERKVRVSGSTDGANWTPLVTDGIIFDYSRYMDVSNREIALPKNSFREFKVTIEDVTDEKESPFKELTRTFRGAKEDRRIERTTVERRPFRIDRIDSWSVVTRDRIQRGKTAVYPVVRFEANDDAANKQTVITVLTRREPISRFMLETSSRNFSRPAAVEAPVVQGVNTQWHSLVESTIFNFSFRNQHREQLAIAFPDRREETLRIVIRNEDNPHLNVTGVKAAGSVQRVVFLAQPSRTYRVYYGSDTATTPKYEAATVLATLRQESAPVSARLGTQTENAELGETSHGLRDLFNNWIFLGVALCLMVVVLGWCLYRAGRRLESFPKQ